MPDRILALLCHVDDFCQQFEPRWPPQLVAHGGDPAAARSSALSQRDHDEP
jgi:hypothetical protein